MTRLPSTVLLSLLFISCKSEYKRCEIQTTDNYLKAYNDILNEIITERSFGRYLGKDEERIFEKYATKVADSGNIKREVIRLHNKIFSDTSRFCTIYLDTALQPAFNSWSFFQKDTNSYGQKIRTLIGKYSDNEQEVIDSLNSMQDRFSPQDFTLCIGNIKSIKESKDDNPKCFIGKIVLSKLIFNKAKNEGLLYYEFRCGELCGYGNLIAIEKQNNHWQIQNALRTWIS